MLVDLVIRTPVLSSLLNIVVKTGLAPTLASAGPFTVFAPNNAAFAAIAELASTLSVEQLRQVLLLHVASGVQIKASDLFDGLVITTAGGGKLIVRKNGMNWKITNADGTSSANIVLADQFASNGVAHVIDGVIMPPAVPAPPSPPVYTPAPPSPPSPTTLVDVVAGTPILSSLLASVVKADLAATLAGAGPFTVFAPNNAAFAAIANMPLSVQQLQNVLLLHVVGGVQITASDLFDGKMITTAGGGKLIVRKNGMNWKITNADGTSSANIVLADQFASNGVAHVIDGVIMPPANTPAPPSPPVYTPAPPSPSPPSPLQCSQIRKRDCKTQLTNGACAWDGDVRQCKPVNFVRTRMPRYKLFVLLCCLLSFIEGYACVACIGVWYNTRRAGCA
jgi:transforming growth factor-beta-induced protein